MSKHTSHANIAKRLKRVYGHLNKVIEMIDEERSCLDVAQQLQAVCSSLNGAKKAFIQDHVEHCLDEGLTADAKSARKAFNEMKEIAKYL